MYLSLWKRLATSWDLVFFPIPQVFTDFLIMKQPVIPQEWVGGGRWGQLYLFIYFFILETLHFILSKSGSQAFTVCEKGEKHKSAPLLLNYSRWNYLGRGGHFFCLQNESLSALCRWPFYGHTEQMLPIHPARSNLPDSRGRIFVDKIKNTKLYIETYFHFQLLLDLCI